MPRTSVALFLSTLALAGATAACSRSPEAGEEGGDRDRQEMTQPASPNPATQEDSEGGEGGEGGEGCSPVPLGPGFRRPSGAAGCCSCD